MSSTVLIKGHSVWRYGLLNIKTFHKGQTIRSASLNSAIGRGLRRSQGVGFRGKEKDTIKFGDRNSAGLRDRGRDSVRPSLPPSGLTREGWRNSSRADEHLPKKRETPRSIRRKELFGGDAEKTRSRRARFHDVNSGVGKGSRYKPTADEPVSWRPASSATPRRSPAFNESARRAAESDLMAMQRNPDAIKISSSRKAFLERASGKQERHTDDKKFVSSRSGDRRGMQDSRSRNSDITRRDSYKGSEPSGSGYQDSIKERVYPENNRTPSDNNFSAARNSRNEEGGFNRTENKFSMGRSSKDEESSATRAGRNFSMARSGRDDESKFSLARGSRDEEKQNDERPVFRESFDKRIPLSIPYTTPASEFLYGTSVIETALSAKKEPKRKLYKLYIYSGENRDNVVKDVSIERLARKAGVEVVHVNTDWIRLMDKMSGGRPHNGYILEASPLPKIPVIGLGPITSKDDMNGLGWENQKHGFSISLDYQSREEADINGTSTFIEVPRDPAGRKPFVLLLDSILDPGNLGGILRSASFLGVTAIAISTRNSASFTPVVMKASAGASESITILSVNKPAGFLENSKAAGWKIYAAVAPSSHKQPGDSPAITTDELANPLSEDPCILMLGNEGEGLRWNLRNKANWDISIPGSERRGAIDSLNVSVAAGILCSAFMRDRHESLMTSEKDLDTFLRPKRELF